MIRLHIRRLVARSGRIAAFVFVLAAFAIAACSSDPPSPLGSDDDLISSTPGVIFEDTLVAFADTVLQYYTCIAADTVMEFGRVSGYQRSMIIQFSFDGASLDVGKVVQTASLRLTASDVDGTFPARFYLQPFTYSGGDSVPSLDTLSVIMDPVAGSPDRAMQTLPRDYALPPSLVQAWIRGDTARTAIAIVYTDNTQNRLATFRSSQALRDHPTLQVTFTNASPKSYKVASDATFMRATTATSNLVISDGDVRRTYFRVPLDQLTEKSAIHNARVRLHVVAGSVLGSNSNLVVFIPATDSVTSPDFLSGQLVTTASFQASSDYVEFTMTNAIALMLQGVLDNNGVVVRFDAENSELRQVKFYGSAAPDSLRPKVFVTSSTPADFDPPVNP